VVVAAITSAMSVLLSMLSGFSEMPSLHQVVAALGSSGLAGYSILAASQASVTKKTLEFCNMPLRLPGISRTAD